MASRESGGTVLDERESQVGSVPHEPGEVSARVEIADVIDAAALQEMMNDFSELTSIPMALVDLDGRVLVAAGWQDACVRYHRAKTETCKACIESDTVLTAGIPTGEARLYKCKNGMWDAAMPVVVGDRHVANVFAGQFFFDDEEVDYDFFTEQARRYGFPLEDYLDSIRRVPRLPHAAIDAGLRFLAQLSRMLSRQALTNAELAALAAEHAELLSRERRNSERLLAITEVDRLLSESLALGETIERALQSAEERLSVVASSVWTLNPTGDRLVMVGSRNFPDTFLEEFHDGLPLDSQFPITQAAASRKPILFGNAADQLPHDGVVEAYSRYGIRLAALAAVPLVAKGAVIGGMTLAWDAPQSFDEDAVALITSLAGRFSAAIENARVYEAEHLIAETLQTALLQVPESISHIEFAHSYRSAAESARVGGDFYDIFEMVDGLVGITIGDVAGKGLDAAVLTSMAKYTIRAHAIEASSRPEAILAIENELICRATPEEAFVTLFFGVLDCRAGKLLYASGGHTTGALVAADGRVRPLKATGPLVGAFSDATFEGALVDIRRDDVLVLYTDGLTEARRGEELYGEERLFELLATLGGDSPAAVLERLVGDVTAYSGDALTDDLALLVVGCGG